MKYQTKHPKFPESNHNALILMLYFLESILGGRQAYGGSYADFVEDSAIL
jgi:hypothetical protein